MVEIMSIKLKEQIKNFSEVTQNQISVKLINQD